MTNLGAVPRMLATAARLLAMHWPAFLVFALLGAALREAALWGALVLSDWNSYVAQLLLIFAPLGFLLPIIAMLHRCRGSLPRTMAALDATAPTSPTEGRERRLPDVAVSVLIPFVTVYAALGLHDADFEQFANSAAYREFQQTGWGFLENIRDRLGLYPFWVVVVIVVVSWVIRWALAAAERRTEIFAIAFVGVLVEVYYTGQLVNQVVEFWKDVSAWFQERRFWTAIESGYADLLDSLGSWSVPFDGLVQVLGIALGSIEMVVIVPAAWLTIAAIVLGHRVMPAASMRRSHRMKAGSLQVADTFFDDVVDRWAVFWYGLRMILRTGFAPIAVFSAIFLLAARGTYWFGLMARELIGPTDTVTYLSYSLTEEAFGLALSMILIAPLLAAATEWLVLPANTGAKEQEARRTPEPRTPATLH